MLVLPPLALYVHIPWCVQKCPYCDFNSHAIKQGIPETAYVQHLLDDLDADMAYVQGRPLHSIFIGGGTPSVFSAEAIQQLMAGIKQRFASSFATNPVEVTMEANPGTFEAERFAAYVDAGITRFSIGVQSFQSPQLTALGRIHNGDEAIHAATLAQQLMSQSHTAQASMPQCGTNGIFVAETRLPSGLQSFNLDLMHGLPQQGLTEALADLQQAIDLAPPHLSWYQLTIEPNTPFASKPPVLPEDDTLWDIQQAGHELLIAQGYQHYETSAYAKVGYQCQHNLNYWRFGDYLGIGCGAHGKITLPAEQRIIRTVKVKHPKGYMDLTRPYLDSVQHIDADDLPFEFFMNRFRLLEPCAKAEFSDYTGLPLSSITSAINQAVAAGLLHETEAHWQLTANGVRYLNDVLSLFLPE